MSEDFKKVCRLGVIAPWEGAKASLFVTIIFKAGKLSITGVEGPKSNGDAIGSCGQIDGHPWDFLEMAEGWTPEMADKLRLIWGEWHLNDMRPYSPEMKAMGWHELAGVKVDMHKFRQNSAAYIAKKAATDAALAALKAGETFTPTPDEIEAANIPYSVELFTPHGGATPAAPKWLEPSRHISGPMAGSLERAETKTLGWLRPSEHPQGLLGRKINETDSHGYGGKWWREDVPGDVLVWLQSLPNADRALPGAWGRD